MQEESASLGAPGTQEDGNACALPAHFPGPHSLVHVPLVHVPLVHVPWPSFIRVTESVCRDRVLCWWFVVRAI